MSIDIRDLYRSEVVAVTDVRCRPHNACRGAEEVAAGNDIVFPRRGCFIRHVRGHQDVADANTLHFFRKHEPYHVSHPVSGGDDCTSLSFAPDVLTEAFVKLDPSVVDDPEQPFRVSRAILATETIASLHRLRRDALQPDCAADGSHSLLVDERALHVLDAAAQAAAPDNRRPKRPARVTTTNAHRALVEHARIVLSERIGEPMTLTSVAQRVCSSPFHLARIFRRMTGLSLHRYRACLRLRAALERLAGDASDLTALALSLGFSSQSHFSDAFRREFLTTPSAFRAGARDSSVRQMSKNLKAIPPHARYA